MIAGATTFIVTDSLLDRRVERTGGGQMGLSLLAAVTLDGVPENLALGTTIIAEGGSLALLVCAGLADRHDRARGLRGAEGRSWPSPRSFGFLVSFSLGAA